MLVRIWCAKSWRNGMGSQTLARSVGIPNQVQNLDHYLQAVVSMLRRPGVMPAATSPLTVLYMEKISAWNSGGCNTTVWAGERWNQNETEGDEG
eukprot:2278388-Ditylum_brightwellii.AAC.1